MDAAITLQTLSGAALLPHLDDEDAGVRAAAAAALRKTPSPEAQAALLALATDPVEDVRLEALQVMREVLPLREGPDDVGCEEERPAGRAMRLGTLDRTGRKRVLRSVDADGVTARMQCIDEAPKGERDPADHGPVDFGEDRDAHPSSAPSESGNTVTSVPPAALQCKGPPANLMMPKDLQP